MSFITSLPAWAQKTLTVSTLGIITVLTTALLTINANSQPNLGAQINTSDSATYDILSPNVIQNGQKSPITIPHGSRLSFYVQKSKVSGWIKTGWTMSDASGPLACVPEGETWDTLNCGATDVSGQVWVQAYNRDNSSQQTNKIVVNVQAPPEGEFVSCVNPPANHLPSTCIDKYEGGQWNRNASFSCMNGYEKREKECVSASTATQADRAIQTPFTTRSYKLDTKLFYDEQKDPQGRLYLVLKRGLSQRFNLFVNGPQDLKDFKFIYRDSNSLSCSPSGYVLNCLTGNNRDSYGQNVIGAQGVDPMTGRTLRLNDVVVLVTSGSGSDATSPASPTPTPCSSPYVPYQGKCVDPIPACKNPPANNVACIDKIENGQYIERFNFACKQGFEKVGKECVSTGSSSSTSYIPPTTTTPSYRGEPASTSRAGYEEEITATINSAFADTTDPAAEFLFDESISGGYENPEGGKPLFNGHYELDRAQMAKFMGRYLDGPNASFNLKNNGKHADLQANSWYEPYMLLMVQKGIFQNSSYLSPAGKLNWAQMTTMFARAINWKPVGTDFWGQQGQWWADGANLARTIGVTSENDTFYAEIIVNRFAMAEFFLKFDRYQQSHQ